MRSTNENIHVPARSLLVAIGGKMVATDKTASALQIYPLVLSKQATVFLRFSSSSTLRNVTRSLAFFFVSVATANGETVRHLDHRKTQLCLILRHSLDIISNIQNGGRLCLKAVSLNDFQAL